MLKKLLFAALICNIFSLSAMSPKKAAQSKYEKSEQSRKKDGKKRANLLKKKISLNSGCFEANPESPEMLPPATRKSSDEWREVLATAKKRSNELLEKKK
jgi:hypothetical protein